MGETNASSAKAPFKLQAQLLRLLADSLDALADALPERIDGAADLLDAEQALAEFGVGRDGLKNAARRGELTLSRGARGKLLVARCELRRWLESRPYKGKARAMKLVAPEDDDTVAREIRAGRLILRAGK